MNPRSPHMLVIAAGFVLSAALYSRLPAQIQPLGRPMVAFLLPTAAAVTYILLRRLFLRHPVDAADSSDAVGIYDAVMLRVVSFLIAVHAVALTGIAGILRGHPWAARIVPVLLGLTLIGVGNLLPRMRPNLALGIRTARTLTDRGWWMRTHRITGYTVVALGAVIVVAAIAVPPPFGPSLIVAVAPAAALVIPILVLRSQRHAGVRR